jgi:MFS transporter, DHA1 family, multidrug resistance protein
MAAAEPATLPRPAAAPPAHLIVLLGALSTFGPLSMDMYLPGLPDLTRDLSAPAWAAQMSITTCMAGGDTALPLGITAAVLGVASALVLPVLRR